MRHAAGTTQTTRQHEDDDPPRPGVSPGPIPSESAVRRAGMARPPVGHTSGAVVDALEHTNAQKRARRFRYRKRPCA
eukprot:3759182-Prymnesium_polylepis.2